MPAEVKDRVALIVGAVVDDVGEAIALQLADQGAKVVLCCEPCSGALALIASISERGGEASVVGLDLASAHPVQSCVSSVLARYGRIDILVNNSADAAGTALRDLSEDEFRTALVATLGLQFSSLREIAPVMQKSGYGRIINISSLAYLGMAKKVQVAAAQAGVFGMTRAIALEVARDHITVNNVVKGDIATAATSSVPEEERTRLANGIPVKRLGTPADVANVVGFFAAESSKYITGQTLFVCGGKSAYFSMSV